jgi:diguanylate cyclase (GGDEF)-like protein
MEGMVSDRLPIHPAAMHNPLPPFGRPEADAGTLDEQLARSLRPIALAASGIYLLAMLQRGLTPGVGPERVLTTVIPLTVFLLVGLLPAWRPLPASLANPVLVLGMGLITVEALGAGRAVAGHHLHWALIGVGAVVLRPRWAMAAGAAVLVPWLVASSLGLGGWGLAPGGYALDTAMAALLGSVIFIARRRAVLGLVVARRDLTHLALTDSLTGLANRRGLEQAAALTMACHPGVALELVYMDLDGFKQVNDRLGHAEGDRALVAVADVLRATFRAADVVGRVGGDEFLVLVAPGSDAGVAARRLQDRLAAWRDDAGRYQLRASVGTAMVPGSSLEAFWAAVEGADRRMYADKVARRSTLAILDVEPAREPAAPTGRPFVAALG